MNTHTLLEPASLKAGAKKKTRITLRNEEKILDAAQAVIAEFGFHGATIDLIAERAGISKPNLHYYFPTKVDLQIAALRRTLDVWVDSLAKLDPEGDPAVQLSRYIAEKIEMARQNPVASRVFANEILRGAPLLNGYLRTELRALVAQKAKVIQSWIAQGKLAPIEPTYLVFLIWAATQHYADFAPQVRAVLGVKSLTPKVFQEVDAFLCNVVLRGVLPRVVNRKKSPAALFRTSASLPSAKGRRFAPRPDGPFAASLGDSSASPTPSEEASYRSSPEIGKTSVAPKAAGSRALKSNRRTAPNASRKRI